MSDDKEGCEEEARDAAAYVAAVSRDFGVMAQKLSAGIWYAVANALAEEALANPDRSDAEIDRTCGRGDAGA
jgi:hypothetical protein